MRKTSTLTIDREGRDKGKTFVLTERSAADTERWALRVSFALMNTGVEIPADIAESGVAGIVSMGLQAIGKLPYEAAEPLLADMWDCVQIMPDPSKKNVVRDLIEQDIEEVATLLEIRKAVIDLHTGFFTAAAQ